MVDNQRKCLYLPTRQCKWISEMAKLNNKPESFFVKLALDKLIELTGGYPE